MKSFQALRYIDEPEDEEEDAVNRQWKHVWSIFDEYLFLSVQVACLKTS